MSEFHEYELSKPDFDFLDMTLREAIALRPAPARRAQLEHLQNLFSKAFNATLYFEKD